VSGLSATEVRSRLDHPVVDIDGHTVEFFPALAGELVKEGVRLDGESMLRRTSGTFGPIVDWYRLSPEERADLEITAKLFFLRSSKPTQSPLHIHYQLRLRNHQNPSSETYFEASLDHTLSP
jgi:hypothetical protein